MKVKPYIFPALLVIAAMTLLSFEHASAAGCGAELEFKGGMPLSRSPVSINASMSQWGFMVESSIDPFPPTFNVNLHGRQNFKFRYSENVTDMRLRIGSETLYEGKPIKSYDATDRQRGTISVEIKWTGIDASIQVTDECSF